MYTERWGEVYEFDTEHALNRGQYFSFNIRPLLKHGKFGSSMNQARTKLGSSMDQAWIKHGSSMDQAWIKHGLTIGQPWILHGSIMHPFHGKTFILFRENEIIHQTNRIIPAK